jgi:hypothetical protein
MSDFGDISGVSSAKGYDYQKLIAAYYLIVKGAREIEYEVDGEDILIINEDPNRNSFEYIQVKCESTGTFTLSDFSRNVFPQFWSAFSDAIEKYPDKRICCTLITSVTWQLDLKTLMTTYKKMRERGVTLEEFDHTTIKRQVDSMKSGKDQFGRFVWGLRMVHTFPPDHVKDNILEYMANCGVLQTRSKLAEVINFISEKGQGRITRRQIEELLSNNLIRTTESSDKCTYSESQINKILSDLETTKSKYWTEGEFPDEDETYREMTEPVKKASKVILNRLNENTTNSEYAPHEILTLREIILSDTEKAQEEAQTISRLRTELWICGTRFNKKIDSMKKTAESFGITSK